MSCFSHFVALKLAMKSFYFSARFRVRYLLLFSANFQNHRRRFHDKLESSECDIAATPSRAQIPLRICISSSSPAKVAQQCHLKRPAFANRLFTLIQDSNVYFLSLSSGNPTQGRKKTTDYVQSSSHELYSFRILT